jgi:DNA-binding CsgD family transcriptional regulator
MARFLELTKALSGADWLELELQPHGTGAPRHYRLDPRSGDAASIELDIDHRFAAVLHLGLNHELDPMLPQVISDVLDLTLRSVRLAAENRMLRGAFDSTSSAVLLFSRDGDIVHANSPADDLLSLQTEDNLIVDDGPHHGQPLFQVLCTLVEEVLSDRGRPKKTSTLRVAGAREMICEVARLEPAPTEEDPRSVMVILRAARAGNEVRLDAFSAAHGLSPREQEVVERLLLGMKTSEMANDLGISPHTVRDHLKHLYRKTSVGSRSELVGLISRERSRGVEESEPG